MEKFQDLAVFYLSVGWQVSIFFDNLLVKRVWMRKKFQVLLPMKVGATMIGPVELPMHDGQNAMSDRRAENGSGGVSDLAATIVARLAARDHQPAPVFVETIVQRLTEAVSADQPSMIEALKPELKRARISPAMLADIYIPEAARRLGKSWEDDTLTFADVTIGTVRLQSILRDISAGWAADASNTTGASGSVLLLLPEKEHHTLGPLVVTGQLRRRGVSVSLQLATESREWRSILSKRHFDGVIISVGWEGKIAACVQLIGAIKQLTKGRMPVAVGGAVLTRSDATLSCEGADVVTNDLDKVLSVFGLSACVSRAFESA